MIKHLRFIIIYHLICLVIITLLKFLLGISMEIFSYLLYFYLAGFFLGVLLYPFLQLILKMTNFKNGVGIFIDSIFCLGLLNIIGLLFYHRILTYELLMGITGSFSLRDNILLVHAVSFVGFVLSICFLNKKRPFG